MASLTLDPCIVALLTQDLRQAEPEARETALDRLGVCFGDHANLIAESLDDPEPEVRASAAANLGGLRHPHAWPHLVRSARMEPSDEIRRHIVLALEGYIHPAILDVLLEVLGQRDRDYRIRLNVVRQLWKYDPGVVAPRLEAVVMSDDHHLVRLHAADSLDLVQELLPSAPSRRELWLRLSEDDAAGIANIAANALRRVADSRPMDLVELLSRRLRDPDSSERSIGLGWLSMLAGDVAVSLAKPLLADGQPGVRMGCCACLGAVRDDTAVPLLLATLRSDRESRVQAAALVGLGNYHTVEIGQVLLDALEAGDLIGEARSFLCGQLWKYPSERTISLLRHVLDSAAAIPHREHVERALAFLYRVAQA
jgi:HEAT repeat protein